MEHEPEYEKAVQQIWTPDSEVAAPKQSPVSSTVAEEKKGTTVLVVGSTGYLGKHVIQALHNKGYRIRALVRNADRLGDLQSIVDDIFTADATDDSTLEGACNGIDIIISCLGLRNRSSKQSKDSP